MENKDILLTIAVANYNNATLICRCLDSIVNQLTYGLEILVVDDGSTDCSLEIVNKMASRFAAIKIITQQNAGVSTARNQAISKANGKYITFVDSDDEMAPGGIDAMCRVLREEHPDILITDYIVCHNDEMQPQHSLNCPSGRYGHESINSILSCCLEGPGFCKSETAKLSGSVWDKAYSVEFLRSIGLVFNPELRHGEDVAFNVRAFKAASSMYYLSLSTYHYYINSDSVTHTVNPNLLSDIELYVRDIKNQIIEIDDAGLFNDLCFNIINQIEQACVLGGYSENGRSFYASLKAIAARDLFAEAISKACPRSLIRIKENIKLALYKIHAYRFLGIMFEMKNSGEN